MAAALAPRWLVGLLLAALSTLPVAAAEQARRKEARVHHEVSSVLVRRTAPAAEPAATSLLEVASSAPAVDAAVASAEAVVAAAEKEAAQQEASGAVPADTSDAEAAAQKAVEAAEAQAKATVQAAVPQSAAQLHKDKADSKKASKSAHKKDDSKDEDDDEEGGEDDEDEDDEEDDEEEGKKDKEIHYHVGKEEMGKVGLPKKWPLGPEKVLTEAGGVAVARRLLKENREQQEETKALIENLEDEPKFEKQLAARVDKVSNETDAPSLAKALGKMWTEMRKMRTPFLLPVLKRQEEELKKEEPELEKSLTEKGDKFQDKWTRSILKTKYGKDAAMLSEDSKVRASGHVDPMAHRSAAAPRMPALAAAWGAAVALVLGSQLAA